MQIHEIFRRTVNEGPLKGVRTLPPRNDRGRFMPRAATAAFNQMATQLQNQPTAAAAPAPAAAAPVGLTPADIDKLRAQGTAAPAIQTPTLTPRQAKKLPTVDPTPKAGFFRNAAEYLANRTMNAAGIPVSQQGEYHPGGHQAALQGRSYGFIQKQEEALADRLSSEYINKRTLAGKPVQQLSANEIQTAADTLNRSSVRPLNIDLNKVTKATEEMIASKQASQQAGKQAQIKAKAQQQVQVKNEIEKLEKELAQPNLTPAQAAAKVQAIIAQTQVLKSLGGDPSPYLKAMTTKPAAQPQPPAAPTGQLRGAKPGAPTQQDYANLEKRLQQALAAQGQTA